MALDTLRIDAGQTDHTTAAAIAGHGERNGLKERKEQRDEKETRDDEQQGSRPAQHNVATLCSRRIY